MGAVEFVFVLLPVLVVVTIVAGGMAQALELLKAGSGKDVEATS